MTLWWMVFDECFYFSIHCWNSNNRIDVRRTRTWMQIHFRWNIIIIFHSIWSWWQIWWDYKLHSTISSNLVIWLIHEIHSVSFTMNHHFMDFFFVLFIFCDKTTSDTNHFTRSFRSPEKKIIGIRLFLKYFRSISAYRHFIQNSSRTSTYQ